MKWINYIFTFDKETHHGLYGSIMSIFAWVIFKTRNAILYILNIQNENAEKVLEYILKWGSALALILGLVLTIISIAHKIIELRISKKRLSKYNKTEK